MLGLPYVPGKSTLRGAAWRLGLAAVFVEFTVSANLLTDIGDPYVSEGGNVLTKIHPGSYLAILAGIFRIADTLAWPRGPERLRAAHRPLAVFLCGVTLCCAFVLACNGPGGIIALVDTFLPAGMLALALTDMSSERVHRLRFTTQALLSINAIVALGEMSAQGHLVPVVLSGGDVMSEFRPTGLYDHPLTGAAATMLGVFVLPASGLRSAAGTIFLLIMLAALISFGERAPLALTVLGMAFCFSAGLARKTLRRALRWPDTISALTSGAIGLALLGVTMASGIGSRLTTHLYWDASAQVRMSEFTILSRLTISELIFGCQRAELLALIEPLRLSAGVAALENFWLVMFASLGVLCFPVFLLSLGSLLSWLWRQSLCRGRMMIVTLIVAASASNSLGRKSTLLVMLVVCVLVAPKADRGLE